MITILSNDCPKCLIAKKEFADQNPEIIRDWADIKDPMRRSEMIASVSYEGGDLDARPLVFRDDVFFDWQPGKEKATS